MKKILILLLTLIFASCSAKDSMIEPTNPNLETMTFDVVEKKLQVEKALPDKVNDLLTWWFNTKVKINGFDGKVIFTVSEYKEEFTLINDGKRVDIDMSFNLMLTKPRLSQTKFIEGTVSSFGTLSGDFSLKDFDTVIQNTQADLILRLSRDLKSKI